MFSVFIYYIDIDIDVNIYKVGQVENYILILSEVILHNMDILVMISLLLCFFVFLMDSLLLC